MQVVDAYEAPLLSSNNQIVLTDSGLLVAAGDEAAVAIDTGLGRARLRQHRRPITTEGADVAAPGKAPYPALARASAPAGPLRISHRTTNRPLARYNSGSARTSAHCP